MHVNLNLVSYETYQIIGRTARSFHYIELKIDS